MKKLLTVSVLAIMAVSTANADIASTQYVETKTGDLVFTGQAQGKTDLTAAVNAIASAVGETNVTEQINAAIEGATIDQDQVDGLDDALAGKQNLLDGTNVVTDGTGNVITEISAVNGVVTATKGMALGTLATQNTVTQAQVDGLETTLAGKLNTTDLTNVVTDGDQTHAVTGEAVAEAIKSANEDISLALDDKADKDSVYAKSDADLKFAPINTVEVAEQTAIDSAKDAAIAAAKTETVNQVKALADTQVATNASAIAQNKAAIESNDTDIANLVAATTGATDDTTTGKYALTKIVGEGGAISYGWELIGR